MMMAIPGRVYGSPDVRKERDRVLLRKPSGFFETGFRQKNSGRDRDPAGKPDPDPTEPGKKIFLQE
jgi:hypothetical protein